MILLGDCMERLKELEENSVDAVVTDPPYGWRFMGKAWDNADIMKKAVQGKRPGDTYIGVDGVTRKTRNQTAEAAGKYDQSLKGNEAFSAWTELYAKEILRVLKPGGHALIFCGPRTYHAMAFGVERAGFEIRDMLSWIFGSGFPKSHNLKGDWQGWGTALKPSVEPIVLARKPLSEKTVAANVLRWGVGGLNIDASRIGYQNEADFENAKGGNAGSANRSMDGWGLKSAIPQSQKISAQGRWPANLILGCECFSEIDAAEGSDHGPDCPVKLLDEQSGHLHGSGNKSDIGDGKDAKGGGASRFFYVAKASKRERNAGLEGMALKSYKTGCGGAMPIDDDGNERDRFQAQAQNTHPTVKPLKLMEYLCKLICPPGGTVLDPFAGSGSTGVAAFRLGFKFIGIEMSEEYAEIAKRRLEHALKESAS